MNGADETINYNVFLNVTELPNSSGSCLFCPRDARYSVTYKGANAPLCKRHTVASLKSAIMAVETARAVV